MTKFLLLNERKLTRGAIKHFNMSRLIDKMNDNPKVKNIFQATSWLREYISGYFFNQLILRLSYEVSADEFDHYQHHKEGVLFDDLDKETTLFLIKNYPFIESFPYLTLYQLVQNYIYYKSFDLNRLGYTNSAFMLRQTDIDDVLSSNLSQHWNIYSI